MRVSKNQFKTDYKRRDSRYILYKEAEKEHESMLETILTAVVIFACFLASTVLFSII